MLPKPDPSLRNLKVNAQAVLVLALVTLINLDLHQLFESLFVPPEHVQGASLIELSALSLATLININRDVERLGSSSQGLLILALSNQNSSQLLIADDDWKVLAGCPTLFNRNAQQLGSSLEVADLAQRTRVIRRDELERPVALRNREVVCQSKVLSRLRVLLQALIDPSNRLNVQQLIRVVDRPASVFSPLQVNLNSPLILLRRAQRRTEVVCRLAHLLGIISRQEDRQSLLKINTGNRVLAVGVQQILRALKQSPSANQRIRRP